MRLAESSLSGPFRWLSSRSWIHLRHMGICCWGTLSSSSAFSTAVAEAFRFRLKGGDGIRTISTGLLSQSLRGLLALLVVLAAGLYYWQVPGDPPGFSIDESSISYNAYTISQTG